MLAEEAERHGVELGATVGTMIELPRAALTAGQIAEAAQFFSFGTNDLTQTTWGFSRDDVEGAFFSRYLERGIFDVSPFETIDRDGVGRLVRIAVRRGPGGAAGPGARASAASTAATPRRSTSSTRPGWTTCPARRSGCRSRAWRRAAPLSTSDEPGRVPNPVVSSASVRSDRHGPSASHR